MSGRKSQPSPVETGYPAFGIAGGMRNWIDEIHWKPVIDRFWLIVLAGIVSGLLYPLNTWDYPTYLVITAGSFLPARYARIRGRGEPGAGIRLAAHVLPICAVPRSARLAIVLIGRLLFLPYYKNYASQIAGFDPWTEPRSLPSQYLVIHGFFLFVIASYLIIDLLQTMRPFELRWDRAARFGLCCAALAAGQHRDRRERRNRDRNRARNAVAQSSLGRRGHFGSLPDPVPADRKRSCSSSRHCWC